MKKAVVVAAALLGALCAAAGEYVVVTTEVGAARTVVTNSIEFIASRATWRMAKASVPRGATRVSVAASFCTAAPGEKGWWVLPDNTYGTFKATNATYCLRSAPMAFWAMQTPRGTFVTRVDGMKFDFQVTINSSHTQTSGITSFALDGDTPYEDLALEFTRLAPDANFGAAAKVYRDYQLAHGVRPIRERIKTQKELEQAVRSVEVRIRQAWKPAPPPVEEQTLTNEPPMHVAADFARCGEFIRACCAAGVGKAEFCLVGWNRKGHDGRYPQIFPVEPELGGESALKKLIAETQQQGYLMVCHNNHSDAYSVAECWTPDDIMKDKKGALQRNACWSGGRMYNLCPQVAWEKYAQADLRAIAALGFRGLHYIDVLSCTNVRKCYDAHHPVTRGDSARYLTQIGALSRELFGGYASEGCYDHHAAVLDHALYISYKFPGDKLHPLIDGLVPLWQMVYNGIIVSCPFTKCTNWPIKDVAKHLELVAFGGRPMIYINSVFVTGLAWMGKEDVTLNSAEELSRAVNTVKRAYDEYLPLADLQFCFMTGYQILAPGVTLTEYEGGTKILVNRTNSEYTYGAQKVAPHSWLKIKKEEKQNK